MGLDMYAYTANRANQESDWWAGAELDPDTKEYANTRVTRPREIAYWRKHPNLHGWMEQLWNDKGRPGAGSPSTTFNGIELELVREEIDQLEIDIRDGNLPDTTGFFFGDPADNVYYDHDLEFVKQARADLFMGMKVFYNSSW